MLMEDGKKSIEIQLSTPEWDDKGGRLGPDIADGGHYVFPLSQKESTRFVTNGVDSKLRVMLALSGPNTQVEGGRFYFTYIAKPDPSKPEAVLVVDGKES